MVQASVSDSFVHFFAAQGSAADQMDTLPMHESEASGSKASLFRFFDSTFFLS
jgi:hypothetical protein